MSTPMFSFSSLKHALAVVVTCALVMWPLFAVGTADSDGPRGRVVELVFAAASSR